MATSTLNASVPWVLNNITETSTEPPMTGSAGVKDIWSAVASTPPLSAALTLTGNKLTSNKTRMAATLPLGSMSRVEHAKHLNPSPHDNLKGLC